MSDIPLEVRGFKFAGIHCGIKENPNKPDLALIVSEAPCQVAGSFTTNLAKAAPVILDEKKIKKGIAQAVLINSGNANACTGVKGLKSAEQMVQEGARALKLSPDLVLVSSTGKIGIPLPVEKIKAGLHRAVSSLDSQSLSLAAKAILTTDKFIKIHGVTGKVGQSRYTLVGFGKGAGMIEPAMKPALNRSSARHATMLAYFMTDLSISSPVLQTIFNRVVDATFNRITVDGDMSTNDTALILANGLAGNKALRLNSKEAKDFEKKLEEVARVLALKMVEDGEGATKVVEILVKRAKNEAEAKKVAYAVGRSPLVKTSFFGQDPNWGRLLAAIGYSGATFDPSRVDIYYGPVQVVSFGVATTREADRKAHEVMKNPTFTVTLDLKKGKGTHRIWTSDLNYDYVKLNAEYRT